MRVPPPAASPTASSSTARRTCTRSTSGTASSIPRCAPIRASVVLERVNARTLDAGVLRAADPAFEPCPLVVATCRSSRCAASSPPWCGDVAAAGADLVLLVKPQFEVGRAAASQRQGRGARPCSLAGRAAGVASALVSAGTGIMGAMASPLTGAAGNAEFLVHARKGVSRADSAAGPDEAAALFGAAVAEAAGHLPPGPPGRLSGRRFAMADRHLLGPPGPPRRAGAGHRHRGRG